MSFQAELFPDIKRSESKSLPKIDKIKLIREKIKQGKDRSDLFTVNSISGGRSSAYMAYHHRADLNIFSIVTTDDPRCLFLDKSVRAYVWEKCGTDLVYATLEDDDTIKSVMQLEQLMGEEIFFTYGPSMDSIIQDRKFLPNAMARFCSDEMKITPIFEFLTMRGRTQFHNLDSPTYNKLQNYIASIEDFSSPYFRVNIGYRIDDYERIANFTEHHEYSDGLHETGRHAGNRKWENKHWRVGHFPIIGETQQHIINFWKGKNISFPEMNNCQFCFHRNEKTLNKLMKEKPRKAVFWKQQEAIIGAKFGKKYTLEQIENMNFAEDIDYTSDSMCDSGGCAD